MLEDKLKLAHVRGDDDDEEFPSVEEHAPELIVQGGFMEAGTIPQGAAGSRRNEDIALDLLRFIASATDYAKAGGVGFQSGAKVGDGADRLLLLYSRCLDAVQGKK
jgi:hypothetical protein